MPRDAATAIGFPCAGVLLMLALVMPAPGTAQEAAKPAAAAAGSAAPAAPAPGDAKAQGNAAKPDAGSADSAAAPSAPAAEPATGTANATAPAAPTATSAIPAAPGEAATAPTAPAPGTPPAAAEAPPAPVDPVVAGIRTALSDTAVTGKSDKADVDALAAFYAERSGSPVWVDKDGFTAKGKLVLEEVRRAEDWELAASSFDLPSPPGSTTPEALGQAEAKLALVALKYARHARGGRFNPRSLSRILDQDPPVKDPKAVLADLEATNAPDAYLRGLHPKHEQFERLRQVLLRARGPVAPEEPVDEALKIRLPQGKLVKAGAEHADIALLRQRLKVPAADGVNDTLFDAELAEAVKAFQAEKGLDQTGSLNGATRTALNREGEAKKPDPEGNVQRLLINMERWRWMPEDLGPFYVWDNIPEFMARVIKGGKEEIFKEKIIVGQPAWATPVFSADMQYVIFNPSWGVPDGIKTRELLPRLKAAGGGGFFFFGGGGGGSVIRAYGFNVYRNGKMIDPDSVNWSNTDIRSYSFVQPPGAKNPLGIVKFRFPNKHDVYMHDTTDRQLFAQSYRALSHGCVRVENPRKLAAILLGEDRGWSAEQVSKAIASGGEFTLEKPIPVHVTYFTATVDETGKVTTYGDLYGHDSRLGAALTGRAIRFESAVETASAEDDGGPGAAAKGRKAKKKPSYSGPDNLADAISNFLAN